MTVSNVSKNKPKQKHKMLTCVTLVLGTQNLSGYPPKTILRHEKPDPCFKPKKDLSMGFFRK